MKLILNLLCIVVSLTSCSYRTEKMSESPGLGVAQSSMSFAQIQSSILVPKCVSCHHHANDFGTYDATKAAAADIASRVRSTDPSVMMPRPGSAPLTAEEKNALLRWIDRGTPEDSTSSPPGNSPAPQLPPPVEPGLNFAYVQETALKPKCLSCHHHRNDFDSFEHTRPLLKEIQYRIHAFGTEDQMPPENRPQLTAEELKLVEDWINAGAPEMPGLPLPPSAPAPAPEPTPEPTPEPAPVPPPAPAVNFAAVKTQVFEPKCAGCHYHQKKKDFVSYGKVRTLLEEIKFRVHAIGTNDQMPPPNRPQLTADELKLLDTWLAAGAPEL